MNVETITMAPAKAQQKLRAYQKALSQKANAEYEAAAAGYEALAAGKALLDLDEVFRACSYDPKGRPRLAVARADRERVRFELTNNRTVGTFDTSATVLPRTYVGGLLVRVPYDNSRASQSARQLRDWDRVGHAIVPMVPADVVPAGVLRERHILWEVEAWADAPIRSTPDRDPYLLRHLAGSLYVVEAAWDLTDLERAIINGRKDG